MVALKSMETKTSFGGGRHCSEVVERMARGMKWIFLILWAPFCTFFRIWTCSYGVCFLKDIAGKGMRYSFVDLVLLYSRLQEVNKRKPQYTYNYPLNLATNFNHITLPMTMLTWLCCAEAIDNFCGICSHVLSIINQDWDPIVLGTAPTYRKQQFLPQRTNNMRLEQYPGARVKLQWWVSAE